MRPLSLRKKMEEMERERQMQLAGIKSHDEQITTVASLLLRKELFGKHPYHLPSDGTVESSESKIIQEHIQAIQDARQEAAANQRRRESIDLANQTIIRQREDETARLETAESSVRELKQRVDALRHQIEMRIKAPGARLKSAPFHSAADEAALAAYTDVLIVIFTPRWYGVETPDGQRGWVPLDQLEPLP